MKLTLHNPPEGFEAEAEYRYPFKGEIILDSLGSIDTCWADETPFRRIVLTPKKRKYWRLDPVATFEEAAKDGYAMPHLYGLSIHNSANSLAFRENSQLPNIQWLRVTECEE